jgi:hypothetical protein
MRLLPVSLVVSGLLFLPAFVGCQGDDNALPVPPDASADAKGGDATVDSGLKEGSAGDAAEKDASTDDVESQVESGADGASSDGSADGGVVQEAGPDGSQPDASPLDGAPEAD